MTLRNPASWIIGLTLAVACALPVILSHHVPLVDYPTHLARMYILHQYKADPFLQSLYDVSFAPRPNLAMDLVVSALAKAFTVENSARAFVCMALIVNLTGVGALNHAAGGKFRLINVLLGALFLHNWVFAYGFLNFMFGIGVMLWAIALWLIVRRASGSLRIGLGIIMALILYLCHIVPFLLFSLGVAVNALQSAAAHGRIDRRHLFVECLVAFVVIMPVVITHMLSSPVVGGIHEGIHWSWWPQKMVALMRTPLGTNMYGDIVLFFALATLVLVVFFSGGISMITTLRPMVALSAVLFLLAPDHSRLGFYLNERLVLILMMLVAASVSIEIRPRAVRRVTHCILTVAVFMRSALLADDWMESDRAIRMARHAFGDLDRPAVIYAVQGVKQAGSQTLIERIRERYAFFNPPSSHMTAYAALEDQVFSPIVYADPVLQPIRFTENAAKLASIQLFNPISVKGPAEWTSLMRDIARLHRQKDPTMRHVYVYFQQAGAQGWVPHDPSHVAEELQFVIFKVDTESAD